jgi:hypothetical protein
MNTQTVKQYTILFQYILLLKEPLYIFLIQIFQHLSPVTWWEDFIEPVLQRKDKENFKYLDIADLLNVFKMNWERIFQYLDKNYQRFNYNSEYKMVNKVHRIRTMVAHANDVDMSPFIFTESLACLLDFAKLICAKENLVQKLEQDWIKYTRQLPPEPPVQHKDDKLKERIFSLIEERVLLKAVNTEGLPSAIKLSVNRTMLRLHSMRTIEEIMGFFNNAIYSKRGLIVGKILREYGLQSFEDIKDEANELYSTEYLVFTEANL